MSVYLYETENLEFSWRNDKSLVVKHKGVTLEQEGVSIQNFDENAEIPIELYYLEKENVALRIMDFDKQDYNLPNRIIPIFIPINRGHIRSELVKGLRYFKLANHYKILVPQDIAKVKLDSLTKDYDNIREKLPSFLKELESMETTAVNRHIQEPLVSSTGLMVYSTLEKNWLIGETAKQAESLPEYIHYVDSVVDREYVKAYEGLQNECINFVMEEQKNLYGFSISDIIKKRNDRAILIKMVEDLEIVLKVDEFSELDKEIPPIRVSEWKNAGTASIDTFN